MFLWILALLLVVSVSIVGYYQGALRAVISLVGLVLAAIFAKPLARVFDFILPALGLAHPAVLAFISPVLAFILVVVLFKLAGLAAHRKVDTWYKYKGSDTQRLLWERLNSRLGISVGLINGMIYVFALCTLIYSIGYFTAQMATSKKESWMVSGLNRLARDIATTGMFKSIAPFNPATETYFDSSDILADIFHAPLLQNRLANYPLFLTLGDRPEFEKITDAPFQEKWAAGMSLREFAGHESVKPLIQSRELFTNVLGMVRTDLKDLKMYLETGVSPKFDEEKILGRWAFNFRASVSEARRRKPTIGSAELTRLRRILGAAFANSTFIATVDNQAILKLPAAQGGKGATRGVWKSAGGGQYILNISEGDQKMDVEAKVDGKRMVFVKDGIVLVYENTRV